MLYQTHHPPFISSSPSSLSLSLRHLSLPPLEMERIEGALKSSVRKEMGMMRLTPPAWVEDSVSVSGHNNGVSSEDFSVDDLLDFSNEAVFPEEEDDAHPNHTLPDGDDDADPHSLLRSSPFSASDHLVPATELSLPADDLANLEWLSHFVEDSFSEYSAPHLTEKPAWMTGDRRHPVKEEESSCFKSPVPAKARSKRARSGGRVWSSSSSTSSSSSSEPKRQKKKGSEQARRCSHCGVQKTPQWRAGPLGAKTLCNACGVRYKSGRLLPEYRPACSPTFSSHLHSNNHRKVLEMRRNKDLFF